MRSWIRQFVGKGKYTNTIAQFLFSYFCHCPYSKPKKWFRINYVFTSNELLSECYLNLLFLGKPDSLRWPIAIGIRPSSSVNNWTFFSKKLLWLTLYKFVMKHFCSRNIHCKHFCSRNIHCKFHHAKGPRGSTKIANICIIYCVCLEKRSKKRIVCRQTADWGRDTQWQTTWD